MLIVQDSKVAKVYDWDPVTRELLVTFEVDELAFIDAGIPSTEDSIVQFDAGVANASDNTQLPHVIVKQKMVQHYYIINCSYHYVARIENLKMMMNLITVLRRWYS